VTGLIAEKDGAQIEIHASKGVILAAGGFEHNLLMRQEFMPHPESTEWTVASEGNTGDGILAGMEAGGSVDLMEDAWWGPSSKPPGEPPFFHVGERGYPGLIIVNQQGERFTNESAPYIDVVHAMYTKHSPTTPHIPSFFIFDQRYRDRYLFGLLFPRQPIPKKYLSNGYFKRSDTIEALELLLGIPPRKLAETIARFNRFAKSGVDLDYHRGESAYDHYYGDLTVKPNPNLAPLDKPPFYAVEALPGDLGTKGGLVIDGFARVLDKKGKVIPGLYCTGNNSASVVGNSYPGPGGTIGPAMTFGFIAARHIAGIF
jgi:3-oxosteroid 1-dehydrogenase